MIKQIRTLLFLYIGQQYKGILKSHRREHPVDALVLAWCLSSHYEIALPILLRKQSFLETHYMYYKVIII